MRKRIALFILLIGTPSMGCIEPGGPGTLSPMPDGSFMYVLKVNTYTIFYTDEDTRLLWISEKLSMNGLCPQGYVVTDRREILSTQGDLGDKIFDFTYFFRCK